jgi:hypothetical protein
MNSREITVAGFVALAALGAVLELLARRPGSRIPPLGVAIRRIMSTRSGRVGLVAGWAWLGLHFFAR